MEKPMLEQLNKKYGAAKAKEPQDTNPNVLRCLSSHRGD